MIGFVLFAWLFAASIGIQVFTAIRGSQIRAQQLRQQAKLAEKSGAIDLFQAKFQAEQFIKAGREQAEFIRRDSERNIGLLVAQSGTSGLELRGSPLAAIADQIQLDEDAAATVMINASAGAASVRNQGESASTQAEVNAALMRSQADIAIQVGWLNAISAGVSGAAQFQAHTGGQRTDNFVPSTTRFGGPR